MIKILFIGDIFGSSGRECLSTLLPGLKKKHGLDLVVANGENASGGLGLAAPEANEIFMAGVDVITSGNHIWMHKNIEPLLKKEPHLLRPDNYPPGAPGRGWVVARTRGGVEVAVVNLEGRAFMGNALDCPFRALEGLLAGPLAGQRVVMVDFHAEATSEKASMAWQFNGRVSALLGTHTHVPTADNRVLPGGTAFQSDVGMTGPHGSVIGMQPEVAIGRFMTGRHFRFQSSHEDPRLQAALLTIDEKTGKALAIERINQPLG